MAPQQPSAFVTVLTSASSGTAGPSTSTSHVVLNETGPMSSSESSSMPKPTATSPLTGVPIATTPQATSWTSVTTTLVFGTTAIPSVILEVPSGSIFTPLPSSTPEPATGGSPSPNSSNLSSWKAFLVAFFIIVVIVLLLRLGLHMFWRRGSTTMGAWPRWAQVMCCYRPPEEDEDDSLAEPQFIRESYLEGGSYSEASRAQALALVREASVGSWRNRVRGRVTRPVSPSQDDPVPPYPGPPLEPSQNPFADPSTDSLGYTASSEEGKSESEKSDSPTRPSGSGPPAPPAP